MTAMKREIDEAAHKLTPTHATNRFTNTEEGERRNPEGIKRGSLQMHRETTGCC